ncbi:MAG: LCP family glycopolymer transferase, partial [Mycobacteriales bacterium]
AIEAALLAEDPANGSGSILLLPSPTLAAAPGYGDTTVGGVFSLPNAALPAATVSDLLGVTVDYTWRLSPAGLAALVDRLGGVTVNVDTTVTGPGNVVVASPGTQHLDGAQASAFASFLGPGEEEQARPPRLQEVLDAVLGELPRTGLAVLLGSLGPDSSPSEPPPALAQFLLTLARTSYADHQEQLPVLVVDTGAAQPSLRIDPVATQAVVDQTLAASIPPGRRAGNNRVLVENNVGTPGLGISVRNRLDAAGLDFVGSQNRTPFGTFRHTVIVIFDDSAASRALAASIANAVGLPRAPVEVSPLSTSVADAILILGPDYRP